MLVLPLYISLGLFFPRFIYQGLVDAWNPQVQPDQEKEELEGDLQALREQLEAIRNGDESNPLVLRALLEEAKQRGDHYLEQVKARIKIFNGYVDQIPRVAQHVGLMSSLKHWQLNLFQSDKAS